MQGADNALSGRMFATNCYISSDSGGLCMWADTVNGGSGNTSGKCMRLLIIMPLGCADDKDDEQNLCVHFALTEQRNERSDLQRRYEGRFQ